MYLLFQEQNIKFSLSKTINKYVRNIKPLMRFQKIFKKEILKLAKLEKILG